MSRVGTIFSPSYRYRYTLHRPLSGARGLLVFICLNPSTADAKKNDPTVTRCIGYGERWGYSDLQMLNLFALRSTDPKELYRAKDPIGPDNDRWITEVVGAADMVVCAWGTHGKHLDRDLQVNEIFLPLGGAYCLTLTKDDHPGHPLYLRSDLTPMVYYPSVLIPPDTAGEAIRLAKGARAKGKGRPGAGEPLQRPDGS